MRPTPHFLATITLIGIIVLAASLSGCAGLNASGVLTITYNTPATTTATLAPGGSANVPYTAAK